MGERLQREHDLPVLNIGLTLSGDTPTVRIQFKTTRASTRAVVAELSRALTLFGLDTETSVQDAYLHVPREVVEWIGTVVESNVAYNDPLWLYMVKPYDLLGVIAWERFIHDALTARPILRLPDVLPGPQRIDATVHIAVVASMPGADLHDAAAQLLSVIETIKENVSPGSVIYVFADGAHSGADRDDRREIILSSIPDIVYVEYKGAERRSTLGASGAIRSRWLRWVIQSAPPTGFDVVHFLVEGATVGHEGAIATSFEPDNTSAPSVVTQAGEVRSLLTAVGAASALFSLPHRYKEADFGLRRFADELGVNWIGSVVLEAFAGLGDGISTCYKLLLAGYPMPAPVDERLVMYLQPRQVMRIRDGSPESNDSHALGPDLDEPAIVVAQSDAPAPAWLSAAERYIEQKQGEVRRFELSAATRSPTKNEVAYYDGIQSGLTKAREIVARYAETDQ